MTRRLPRLAAAALLLALLAPLSPAQIFVDADATGADDGSSWADAFTDLQDALDALEPGGGEIWIAAGSYLPSRRTVPGDARTATFQLRSGTTLRGGFAGGEGAASQANPAANPTVLSGDLGVPGDASDNAYHVLKATGAAGLLLDGLIVRDGNADRFAAGFGRGGGLLGDGGSVTARRMVFEHNFAAGAGAGWYHEDGSVDVSQSTFRANTVDEDENIIAGGGLTTRAVQLAVSHCLFEDNLAINFSFAAGLSVSQGQAVVRDSTFRDNEADRFGAMEISQATGSLVEGCHFEGNLARLGAGSALGLVFVADAVLRDCSFVANEVGFSGSVLSLQGANLLVQRCRFEGHTTAGLGAAIALGFLNFNDVVVDRCDFVDNHWGNGGGALDIFESSPLVTNCRFLGNSSGGDGAAVRIGDQQVPFGTPSEPLFVNCEFSGNSAERGAAVFADAQSLPTIASCTFAHNTATVEGGGIVIEQAFVNVIELTLFNSVLWGNSDPGGSDESAQLTLTGSATASVDFTLIQGLTGALGGIGNRKADPLFVDADGADGLPGTDDDDLRLLPGSPAADSASGPALPLDLADLDCDGDTAERVSLDAGLVRRVVDDPSAPDIGAPLPGGAIPDMGAHERGAWTHLGNALGSSTISGFPEPCLTGEGTLVGGTPVNHQLANAAPSAPAAIFLGLSTIHAPFKQGVLVPAPDIVRFLTTSPAGTAAGPAIWPAGVPSGAAFYLQYFVQDPLGPVGVTASNAIQGLTP